MVTKSSYIQAFIFAKSDTFSFKVTYLVVLLQFQISIPSEDATVVKRNITESWTQCDDIFNL